MRKTPTTLARSLYVAFSATPVRTHRVIIHRFLAQLTRTRASGLRVRVVAAFERLAHEAEGKRVGSITTARPLAPSERTALKKTFSDVLFTEHTDPTLVGGAIVRIQDTELDGSVRGRVERLKRALTL